MATVDYATRKDLVEAIVDFRKRGILAEVVGNGKTLKLPDDLPLLRGEVGDIGDPLLAADAGEDKEGGDSLTPPPPAEDEEETLLGVVEPEEEQVTPEPVAGGTPDKPSDDVVEQPSGDQQSQAEVEPPTGDPQGAQPAEDDEEDLIGAPAAKPTPPAHPTKAQKRNRGNRQS